MSEIVPAEDIEKIVGAPRAHRDHIGRAVSKEQRVYILHSKQCLASRQDVRTCEYSIAMDRGIDVEYWWLGCEDMPVVLAIRGPHLVPLRKVDSARAFGGIR
ncbi:hypothetical protein [Rhodococcoides fascians]|uniref:hypothetical protein n=1 Tax=Rhodococcoides fascians TaxID=1828 RepID=UPI00050CEFA1|nr:hypothetical protein [Rhodococcus fascians]